MKRFYNRTISNQTFSEEVNYKVRKNLLKEVYFTWSTKVKHNWSICDPGTKRFLLESPLLSQPSMALFSCAKSVSVIVLTWTVSMYLFFLSPILILLYLSLNYVSYAFNDRTETIFLIRYACLFALQISVITEAFAPEPHIISLSCLDSGFYSYNRSSHKCTCSGHTAHIHPAVLYNALQNKSKELWQVFSTFKSVLCNFQEGGKEYF